MVVVALGLFIFGFYVLISRKYQVFGKQPIYGTDARIIGVLFLVPFFCYLLTLPFTSGIASITNPTILNLINAIQLVSVITCIVILGYTAFFAPEATLKKYPVSLSETVNTAIAAAYLQISEQDVQNLIQNGTLQARKVGDDYRIHKEILIGYREARDGSVEGNAIPELPETES